MSKTAILSVRIVSDAKKAVAGFNAAGGGLDKLEGKLKGAAAGMTAASAAVVGMGKKALDAASSLQQSTGAVESVFKSQADSIKALAADAADSVGLSANQYQEFASVMGSQLKNLGVAQSDLVPTTDKLITMGADLASMYGGTTADAVEALSAVFRGETDPIEKYGISINQSDVNARLAADGMGHLEGEARKQAETQARLALLTEQSADAQGNFARETDTAAGSAQIAAAHWENAKAALGESLLPIATQAAEKMSELAQNVSKNPDAFARIAVAVLGTTAALYAGLAAVKAWRAAAAIASFVSTAWGAMTGRIVFGNTVAASSSATAASRSFAAWLGAATRTMAVWTMTAARAVASAAMSAAAWVGAGLRAAGSWALMGVRAVASFTMTAASAVASATMTAAAWVASVARTVAAFVAQNAAMLAVRGATLAYAAAQWVLNAALSANPIGIVVVAVAALVAALVAAYNRSEAFRNAVQTAGQVGRAAFELVKSAIASAAGAVARIIGRVGGVGPAFSAAMSIAASAVRVLMAPINGLIGLIQRVIGAIGSIRFPSPPAWMSRITGAAAGATALTPAAPFHFMTPPAMTFAATPDLTAARSPSLADLAAGPLGRGGGGSVTVDNSITIEVDGSGIVDPRRVAEAIRKALADDRRGRGGTTAGGGRRWL